MLAARLLQIGIERADAKVYFFQRDEPLEVIVLGITSADTCFMNGGGYCVLFCHRSPGTHCDGEKWHGIPGFASRGRAVWGRGWWSLLSRSVRASARSIARTGQARARGHATHAGLT